MFPLMTDVTLTPSQIVAATSAMLRIAHVDEACTAEEVGLIRAFYGDDTGRPSFDALLGSFKTTSARAADFADAGSRDLVLATCIMVAYADGELSAPELAALHPLATDLGVDSGRFDHLLALVKDHMLARLAGLPDAGSVAVVAGELG
jgi:tellurite resistance protein